MTLSHEESNKKGHSMESLVIRGFNQSWWEDARGGSGFNILCRQTGCNCLWVRDEEYCLMLTAVHCFSKERCHGQELGQAASRGGGGSTSVNSSSLQSSPHSSVFYLISPGRKEKFPVGSGWEGRTIWSQFSLGSEPFPSNPKLARGDQ